MINLTPMITANRLCILKLDLEYTATLMSGVEDPQALAYSAKLREDAVMAGKWLEKLNEEQG